MCLRDLTPRRGVSRVILGVLSRWDAFNNSAPILGGSRRVGQAGSPGVPRSWRLCRKAAGALCKASSERGGAVGARHASI